MKEHIMQCVHVREDGYEEWLCPECGRLLLIHWPPRSDRQVKIEGDTTAVHTNRIAGMRIYVDSILPKAKARELLAPWKHFINNELEGFLVE